MLGITAQGILLSLELRPYAIVEGAWLCKRAEADGGAARGFSDDISL